MSASHEREISANGALASRPPARKRISWFEWNAHALPLTDFSGNTAAGSGGLWTATPVYHWRPSPPGTAVSYLTAPLRANTVVIGAARCTPGSARRRRTSISRRRSRRFAPTARRHLSRTVGCGPANASWTGAKALCSSPSSACGRPTSHRCRATGSSRRQRQPDGAREGVDRGLETDGLQADPPGGPGRERSDRTTAVSRAAGRAVPNPPAARQSHRHSLKPNAYGGQEAGHVAARVARGLFRAAIGTEVGRRSILGHDRDLDRETTRTAIARRGRRCLRDVVGVERCRDTRELTLRGERCRLRLSVWRRQAGLSHGDANSLQVLPLRRRAATAGPKDKADAYRPERRSHTRIMRRGAAAAILAPSLDPPAGGFRRSTGPRSGLACKESEGDQFRLSLLRPPAVRHRGALDQRRVAGTAIARRVLAPQSLLERLGLAWNVVRIAPERQLQKTVVSPHAP